MSDTSTAPPERVRRGRKEILPEPEGPVRASAYVCEAVSCLSAQSHDILVGLGFVYRSFRRQRRFLAGGSISR